MSSAILTEKAPSRTPESTSGTDRFLGWKTVLFNCSCHTFQEVAAQLMKSIRCSYERGLQLANVVHYTGSAIVYSGPKERCEAVASVLQDIGLQVDVNQ